MEKTASRYRVGISGSYGGLNLGDEAILESIVEQLRNSLPVEITVFSRNPQDTLKRHCVEHAFPVRKLSREEILPEICKLDLLILGGGGILYDSEARLFLREAEIAAEMNVPFMLYAIGTGPLADSSLHELLRNILDRAAAITVREKNDKQVLESSGVRNTIQVTADPAFLLAPRPLERSLFEMEGLVTNKDLIAMSVREPGGAAPNINPDEYVELLSNAADFMVDRFDSDIVFIPMERGEVKDIQYSHAVIARMYFAERAQVLQQSYSAGQMLGLFKHFAFAVGMRLHFLIFAAMQGVPFVALPYASKVTGVLEMLGIEMPTLHVVTAGKLAAYIDRSWDNRSDFRSLILSKLPVLQEAARQNNRIVVDLLKNITPKSATEEKTNAAPAATEHK